MRAATHAFRISIIIPVYNGEKYLEKCIESVLRQTFQDIQIVLVDDKSSDQSVLIEQKYADLYSNKIKLIALEENKGVCNALNIGIRESEGEYICFLADDDWLDFDLCEKMNEIAEEYHSDLIIAPKKKWISERNILSRNLPEWCLGDMSLEKKKYAIVHLANEMGFVFEGMIKKDFFKINEMVFPDVAPDDIPMTPFYLVYAKHIGIAENSYYNYRIHEESTAHQKNSAFYLNIHKAALLMREKFIERNLYETFKEEADFAFILGFYYYTVFNCLARYDVRPMDLMKKMRDMMRELLPDYKENKYIPIFWDRWKLEILLANDRSPEELVKCFPDCDAFLDMSHDGTLKELFGEWEPETCD